MTLKYSSSCTHCSEGTLLQFNVTLMDLRNYQSCSCNRSMNYGEQGVPNSDTLACPYFRRTIQI
jgi:hypothetical protein